MKMCCTWYSIAPLYAVLVFPSTISVQLSVRSHLSVAGISQRTLTVR